ncbi:DUF3331 domain-containing protein [Burkholderia sp. Ac-20379]|uniref:DUF3331 domain-containing protein n=1 Tax=Burkholderia sp. Ac-20379 TaxID=2703900 RepID=UPI001981F242|nr:DUF3331 domain-containing protein [Burkholderia sp. Ac-20379]MBN3724700.1 DUF3331 domain-containing protein [Burkholderia sp. Ac-20379]
MERTLRKPRGRSRVVVIDAGRDYLLIRQIEDGRRISCEQRWRRVVAARAGYCMLSGMPIYTGEQVYGPPDQTMRTREASMISLRAISACAETPT